MSTKISHHPENVDDAHRLDLAEGRRNILVLGTGRSGTSMVAGMFTETHYCGDDYIPCRDANPTGFNEDQGINSINDRLIWRHWALSGAAKLGLPGCAAHRDRRALWLASPRFDFHRGLREEDRRQMRERLTRQPFCYKDPRFSITLRFWEPMLPPGTLKIVVFRSRERTVASMLRECREGYDPAITATEEWLKKHWDGTYRRLLAASKKGRADWIFIDYNELLGGDATQSIESLVGCNLVTSHIDRRISRTTDISEETSSSDLLVRLRSEAAADRRRVANLQ